MASHPDFVNYMAEQLREAGAIRSRKMFGEYGLYCDDVFFAVVCDDQLSSRSPPQGEAVFPDLPKAPPYEGPGIPFWWRMWRTGEQMTELVRITCEALRSGPPEKAEEMTMVFDNKKGHKEFYPPKTPASSTRPLRAFWRRGPCLRLRSRRKVLREGQQNEGFTRMETRFSLCGLECDLCSMHLGGYCPGLGGGAGNQSTMKGKCSWSTGHPVLLGVPEYPAPLRWHRRLGFLCPSPEPTAGHRQGPGTGAGGLSGPVGGKNGRSWMHSWPVSTMAAAKLFSTRRSISCPWRICSP